MYEFIQKCYRENRFLRGGTVKLAAAYGLYLYEHQYTAKQYTTEFTEVLPSAVKSH